MNSEPSVPKCPQCGAAIPADAPQGLCPRCVLLGAATTTDAGKPVPRTEPPSPEALRAAFPHLEIVELIGRGGMGFVYKARQAKLDRTVALKLLPVELGADPHFAERFHREARALARLNHPGIVAVYDFGVSAGFCYLLMEFVDGVNLRQAMQAGRFSPAAALAVVPKICEALQFAHERGVLHRDIKPENLLLDAQGRVKIADFGIAKLVGEDTPDLTLTVSGARLGTPTYMAPEQIEKPSEVDHRADIYSLGVVFYELLTGELPLGRFAPPSAKADLDARVDDIVMRALAKERELRQQSAGEVKTEVETVAREPAGHQRPDAASLRVTSAKQWMRAADGEFRSARMLWGWPVLHIAFGRDPATGRPRVARGIIAIGERAVGGLAIGGLARGIVAFGGLALGLVSVGGLSVGALAFGGLAAGLVSFGGLSLGLLLALGGIGIGWNAGGGLAIGQTVAGGLGLGTTVWDSRMQHPDARWLLNLLQSGGLRLLFFAVMIAGTFLPIGAAIWARSVLNNPPDGSSPRTGASPWLRRLALWFFALGAVSALPVIVGLFTGRIAIHAGMLLLFTALALWTANRTLRLLALTTCGIGLGFGILSNSLFLIWLLRQGWMPTPEPGFGPIGGPFGLGIGLLLGLAELAGFVAAPLVLQRDEVRAAFGLEPRGKAGVPRAWIGAAVIACCVSLASGGGALMANRRVSVADSWGRPTALPTVPAGGDRVWFELQDPGDVAVRFVVNCWSNGIPHVVDEGAWNPGEFATADPTLPKQVHMTRAVRPGGAGQTWEVSTFLADLPLGEEWQATGIPESVPLRAVNTGAAVRLTPGERVRRWLFLPPPDAERMTAYGFHPSWGVSVDLEWAITNPAAQEQFNQFLGIDVVARMELQLPRGQATAIRTTVWSNSVPAPLPGAGMSLLPGLMGEAIVLHWRLRRLNAPGEWELVVTGADDQKLLGPVAVNLGTNVTAIQPPANARLAPTVGTFNRWWPFLPSFVKGNGVTSPDSTFGWGISVDVGPETVLSPAKRIDARPPAKLTLQSAQLFGASLQAWSNGVPIPTRIMMSSVRELGERGEALIGLEFSLDREPHTNRLRLSCNREDGRSAVSMVVPIPAETALLALSNAPPHGLLTNGHLRHWLFFSPDAATTVADKGTAPETALWGVSLDVPAPVTQIEPAADSRERLQQLEREVRPRMMKAIAEAALKELKQRGGEGGEALGLDIQAAEKLLAEAEEELRRIEADTPKP